MDNFNAAMDMLREQFEVGSGVWLVLFGILTILAAVYLLRGIYIYFKKAVESVNFLVLVVPIFLWGFLLIGGPLLGFDTSEGSGLGLITRGADLFIPTFLMLHIWSQVSYRPITGVSRFLWLFVPIILTLAYVLKVVMPEIDFGTIPILDGDISTITVVANVYFVVVSIKSYLLCFNVFYQMPAHMRRSTYQMLIAISAIVVAYGVPAYLGLPQDSMNVFLAIAYIIVMYTLFTAFFIANAANVIVTSRDFVFSSLSTLVITVSLKGNILDWNRKAKDSCLPLPNPKYNEPYMHYRKRILDTCHGTVSPHDENIINIKGPDSENNFLCYWHEIGYMGHKYGYLIEIADVSNIYSQLRYIEGIAFYDNLTLLYNRNAYIERVKQFETSEHMPLLIVVGDVNNLKRVNDELGHLCGDKLLLTVTRIVKELAPKNSFIARIGGDEIVMLVPHANEEKAISFIASVTQRLKALDDPEIGSPSISWGYSVMHDASEDYNDVFRAADAIMYEAKRKSREISISGVVPHGAPRP